MQDYTNLFLNFVIRGAALEVYQGDFLVFESNKEMLTPLLEYIEIKAPRHNGVVIFDKIMGNAAALLCVVAKCKELYSPLGSEPAIKTLEKFGISYHIARVVPYIQKPSANELCPVEKLSLGKTPQEFYQDLKKSNERKNCG